ncbi:MarR family winged helix-turn-helix transcriptional regulator [Mycobacterium sp. pR1184]|uniref:MarR family winged helix-turn-helix transcriptional regulator n=1 Tax=Mycobacterium sp. pR1184 TaxID=3238981 RepID=UPI00351B4637
MNADDTYRSAARAAHDLRVVFSRLRRQLLASADNSGLTPPQQAILSRLGKEGPMSAADLAHAEKVRPQAITPILGALGAKRLIKRRRDPTDGRRILLSLSAAGEKVISGRNRIADEWLTTALSRHCTQAERQTIIDAMAVLDRVTSAAATDPQN